jgi:hypothetical protein
MNKFQIWSLRRLLRVIVRHRSVGFLFRELRREYARHWYEDNDATREQDLLALWRSSK